MAEGCGTSCGMMEDMVVPTMLSLPARELGVR